LCRLSAFWSNVFDVLAVDPRAARVCSLPAQARWTPFFSVPTGIFALIWLVLAYGFWR
jgi:hypothetical protein